MFSHVYTNVPVDTWRTDWSSATLEDVTIAGNATKKYSALDFVGIETVANQLDVSEMDFFHIDIWSPNFTLFGIKLVDFGADGAFGGGDDVEHQVNINSPAQATWVSLDIPLSDFTGLTTTSHIAQYILVGQPTGATTVYVDNVFFYKEDVVAPTEPTVAAPTPTQDAANVISLFSHVYTNVPVDTWRTDWSSATLEDVTIAGNPTKKYSALDFVGIETVTNQLDVSEMEFFHIDIWSPNFTLFGIKLVDFGADGAFGGGDDVEHQVNINSPAQATWVSLDIPLSDFVGLTTTSHIAQYILVGQPTGSTTVYVDNVFFYKEDVVAPTEPTVAAPTPTQDAANVISLFSHAYTNVPVDTWRTDWSSATLEDVTIAGNATKKYSALDYVGIETVTNQLDVSEMEFFHIDIWSPNFTLFGIKLVDFGANGAFGGGDDVEHQVNINAPAQATWVSLDIPLSDFAGLTTTSHIAQYILVGQPTGATTVYVDNVFFYKEAVVGPTEPTVAAPTPTQDAVNVISLFSDAYANVPVDTWRTDWSSATLEDVTIAGNATKKYSALDYVGIETVTNQLDISEMEFFHIDIWSPNFTLFGIKLVDFGANGAFGGGDDVEHQVNINAPAQATWVSLDIPLSDFAGLTTTSHIAQYILVGQPTGATTVYVDNVFFYKEAVVGPTEPTVAAPTPTQDAVNVISLFSDAYANVPVDTWRTDWSSATLEDVAIAGNPTKKYSALDFVGIETVANQLDITEMEFFHIDIWSPNFTLFGIKLVDFGADGAFGGGDDVEHQVNINTPAQATWVSLDIPLSDFAGLTTTAHIAQYILVGQPTGATTVYVDNVYFYKLPVAATITAPSSAAVCAGSSANLSVTLGGGATLASWSTSGSGMFNNTIGTSVVYTPSAADIAAGDVTISIITNDPDGTSTQYEAALGSIALSINALPTPSITGNLSICQGSTTTLNAGAGFANYAWNTGTVTQTLVATTAGTYILTVTNANGCSAQTSANVVVNANPTPSITGNLSICQGSTTTLNAGAGFANYAWNTGIVTQTLVATTAGTYILTVTNANGCTAQTSASVVVNANPQISLATVCNDEVAQITVTAVSGNPTNYSLDGGMMQAASVFADVANGNHTITATNANGCSTSENFATNCVIGCPTITVSGSSSLCAGSSATYTQTGSDIGGTWFAEPTAAGTIDNNGNFVASSTFAGSATIVFTDNSELGCNGLAVITIIAASSPTFTVTAAICEGSEAPILPTASLEGITGTWLPNVVSNTTSGAYTFTPNAACVSNITLSVTVNANPVPTIAGNTTICEGTTSTLDAGEGYANYVWSTDETTQTIVVDASNAYAVTVTDTNGCVGAAEATVTVLAANDPACQSEQVAPVAENVSASAAVNVGSLIIQLSEYTSDANGDALTYNVSQPDQGGSLIFDATTGVVTISIDNDFSGVMSIEYSVSDGTFTSTANIAVLIQSAVAVNLVRLSGKAQNNGNLIEWTTASEINNDYFTLYSSTDGTNYTQITTVKGVGNSNTNQHYQMLDKNAANGLTYYRLTQTDYDGTTKQLGVVTVSRNTTVFVSTIEPNPASNLVSLSFDSPQVATATLLVYDVVGKLVYTQQLNTTAGNNKLTLDVSSYAVGTYFVTINTPNGTSTVKLLKK